MRLQVLVATMFQKDHSLLEKMNIQTNVIVGNQCDFNSVEEFEWNGHKSIYLNFFERGVGLNRNNALMRASGDICLIADDDMVYYDGYEKTVLEVFENYQDADVIIFNLVGRDTRRDKIKKVHKVSWHNYLRYGTARIAFRLKSIRRCGIYFNQCFGGGTEHCHGEDNLFLTDCLKSKLKILAVPYSIAVLTEERESTWECGYNEKYIVDQGFLYRTISRRWWKLLCLQDVIRHRKTYKMSIHSAYKLMTSLKEV